MTNRVMLSKFQPRMNAVAMPAAVNSFVKSNLSKDEGTFNMGYMPMTSTTLERTLQTVSNDMTMKAQTMKMAVAK